MDNKKRINEALARTSKQQLVQICELLFFVFLAAVLVIFGAYLLSKFAKVPPYFMTEDPLQTAKFPWYTGILSNLGVILWSVAIGCSFLGAILLSANRQKFWFLIASGALSTVLAVDDMFMLHDHVLPHRLHIPEKILYLSYGLIIVIYVFYFFRDIISDKSFVILGSALLFLGTSMVMDAAIPYTSLEKFIADSIKFIGIAFWLTYNFVLAVRMKNN